jgi:hypothetical protein
MDKNQYKQMMEQAVPSAALIHKTKNKMKMEETILIKRKLSTAAVVIAAILMISTTAFAAWYFLKPAEVAERFENNTLSAAFESNDAFNINQSVTSGDYIITLLGIVSGKDITDMPTFSDNILDERTYAVVAIQNADGTPMPNTSDDAYGNVDFFASPLIKGLAPWQYNITTMSGSYSTIVVDGIMYRLTECDSVVMFADRGLYFAVTSHSAFYNSEAIIFNAETGEITANPNYHGASVVFDLPIEKSLADPIKAEQYINNLTNVWSDDTEEVTSDAISPDTSNEWDNAEPIQSTRKEISIGLDGVITYTYNTDEYGGGTITCLSEFTDNSEPQSFIAHEMQSEGPNGIQKYAVRFSKDENGVVTGEIVVLN